VLVTQVNDLDIGEADAARIMPYQNLFRPDFSKVDRLFGEALKPSSA